SLIQVTAFRKRGYWYGEDAAKDHCGWWELGIRYSVFGIRYSVSGIRYPVFGRGFPLSEHRIPNTRYRLTSAGHSLFRAGPPPRWECSGWCRPAPSPRSGPPPDPRIRAPEGPPEHHLP